MPELIKTRWNGNSALKAYYRFESGALTTDSSGNGHTLTNNNTVAEGTGVFGGSADLELSSSQYFSISSHADFNFGTGEFAFGGWFKKESNAINGGLAVKISSDDGDGWRLTVNGDNTLSFFVDNGAFSISTSGVTDTSNYYHVVVSRVSGVITMYLNSARVASGSSSIDMDSTSSLHLGTYRSNTANYFDGMLDDWFFIKGSGLSADQIKELYEGRYLGELRPNQFGTTVGLWHLNGNSTDCSGNNNHGTDTAITYSQANGKFGQGADFNGSNGRIQCADSTSLSITGNYTLGFWANIDALPSSGNFMCLVNKYDVLSGGTLNTGFDFRLNNDSGTQKVQLLHGAAGGTPTATVSKSLPTGTWIFLAGVYNGTTIKIYQDGAEIATVDTTVNPADNSKALNIGNFGYYTPTAGELGRYFNGKIDEVFVCTTALTANQIRQIYALGVGKYF